MAADESAAGCPTKEAHHLLHEPPQGPAQADNGAEEQVVEDAQDTAGWSEVDIESSQDGAHTARQSQAHHFSCTDHVPEHLAQASQFQSPAQEHPQQGRGQPEVVGQVSYLPFVDIITLRGELPSYWGLWHMGQDGDVLTLWHRIYIKDGFFRGVHSGFYWPFEVTVAAAAPHTDVR